MPQTVLHVIDHLGPGGAQRLLVDWAPELAARGWRSDVLALHGSPEDAYWKLLRERGVSVGALARSKPGALMQAKGWLWAYLLRNPPDVLHLHLLGSWILGLGAAIGAPRIPVVLHDHSGDEFQTLHPLAWKLGLRPLLSLTTRRAQRVVAVSPDIGRYLKRSLHVPKRRLFVVPNGSDVDAIEERARRPASRADLLPPDAAKDATVALYVGRPAAYKGLPVLLEAMSRLRDDGVTLAVAGVEAREMGLERAPEGVRFLGHRSDAPELMAAADIVVVPSIREPFGLVAVEAMAAGTPVIACRTGGLSDIVGDGDSGLLVEPGDAGALAKAMRRLVGDGDLRQRLAAGGRRRARRFTIGRSADGLARVYEEVARR